MTSLILKTADWVTNRVVMNLTCRCARGCLNGGSLMWCATDSTREGIVGVVIRAAIGWGTKR